MSADKFCRLFSMMFYMNWWKEAIERIQKRRYALEIVNKIKYRINGKYVDKLSLSASKKVIIRLRALEANKQRSKWDIVLWVIVTTKHHTTPIDREFLKSRFRTISKWNKQIIIFKWDRIDTVNWHAYQSHSPRYGNQIVYFHRSQDSFGFPSLSFLHRLCYLGVISKLWLGFPSERVKRYNIFRYASEPNLNITKFWPFLVLPLTKFKWFR